MIQTVFLSQFVLRSFGPSTHRSCTHIQKHTHTERRERGEREGGREGERKTYTHTHTHTIVKMLSVEHTKVLQISMKRTH